MSLRNVWQSVSSVDLAPLSATVVQKERVPGRLDRLVLDCLLDKGGRRPAAAAAAAAADAAAASAAACTALVSTGTTALLPLLPQLPPLPLFRCVPDRPKGAGRQIPSTRLPVSAPV